MWRKLSVLVATALFLSAAALTAQVRVTKPNDFTLELGGKCLIYSLGYQRTLGPNFALEGTISYFGGGGGGDSAGILFLGGGARYYTSKQDASPCIAGGLIYLTAGTNAGPFSSDNASDVYFYLSPGFEYRNAGGFLFRAGVYFLIHGGQFVVWPGLSVGITF